jgi:hypothetical protein
MKKEDVAADNGKSFLNLDEAKIEILLLFA